MAAATAAKQPQMVIDLETPPIGSTVPAKAEPGQNEMSTFERLASTPGMNVDNLERLMQMHERMQARSAEQQFNAAMSAAQQEMRSISADAENPQTHSRYASYAQLDRALRPIYTKHGFGVSYDTVDSAKEDHVRVLAYVTHSGGHARTYRADMPADGKGARGGDVMTKTHATGAAMSYGMRYLLKMIWNVAVGEDDRDGNAPPEKNTEPAGFDDWLAHLDTIADNGWKALQAAFNGAKAEYKTHLSVKNVKTFNRLKEKAAKKDRGEK
jgi:hypothetical protein